MTNRTAGRPVRHHAESRATPATAAAGTMTAIVQDAYGGLADDVLRLAEVDRPTIGDDEVLVRVRAAGLDRGTWHLMTGKPYLMRLMGFGFRRPRDTIAGVDVAGVVAAAGAKVTRFQPGDEVFGIARGSFAQYAAANPEKLAHPLRASALSLFVGQRMTMHVTTEHHADLDVLRPLLEAGHVTPVIDGTFSLAEAPTAMRRLETGHARGKIAISVDAAGPA